MAANLLPITSDGGFTSGGNINSSGDPSSAPSLNDFFSITSAANFAIVTDNANTDQTWTFDDTGNLTLPLGSIVHETNIPDQSLSGSAIALKPIGGTTANQQLLIYPTAADGDHIHLTSGNLYATELFLGSDNLYVKLANTGNVVINSNDGNSSNAMWTFDTDGNLTLPGNTFAVNYANGTQVSIGGGGANTGNVTFSDQIVIGTGSNDGSGGLYLAPGNNSIANSALQYLRVRGGDVVTHIHLDTGNNAFYDQYFGDDAKYVKLELGDTGNVVIGTDDANGNQYSWSFTSDGNLILADGNSIITSVANSSLDPNNANVSTMVFTPDQNYTSQSLVIDPTGPSHIHLRAPGANIDEPDANIFLGGEDSSFEVGYYNGAAPNLYIHSNNNTWTFGTDGNLTTPSNLVIGPGTGSGSRIFQYDEGLEIVGEGANSVVLMGWTANTSAPDSVATIAMNYPSGGEGNILIAVGNNATTVNYWLFDNTGNTTFPRDTGPNTTDPILTITGGANPKILSEDASLAGPANLEITALNTIFTGSSGSAIKIYPDDGEVASDGNLQIWANSGGNTEYSWTFDTTGILTLPQGSQITETANTSVNITANANTWAFGVDGNLTVPGSLINDTSIVLSAPAVFNICTIATAGSGYNTGSSLKATTGGSGTGMTVGIGYGLSNQLTSVSVVNPGTGYVNGDVITVSEGTGGTFVITKYNVLANQTNNNTVQTNLTFANNTLTLPIYGEIASNANMTLTTNYSNAGNTSSWILDTTGNLTLPDTTSVLANVGITLEANDTGNITGLSVIGDSHANLYAHGNITLYANTGGAGSSWTFDNTGNLVLPGNTFAVNYANGTQVSLGGGNVTWSQIEDKDGNSGPTIITLGQNAGFDGQGNAAIAIGKNAGQGGQGDSSITIGEDAGGNTTQGANAVAIGRSAGFDAQGEYAVAIGQNAGYAFQGLQTVAVGLNAGSNTQSNLAVAIGVSAGSNTQGDAAVAIGATAGFDAQGNQAVAIGTGAGETSQGTYAVAIGSGAGANAQGNNSIILNATGANLNQTTANTFTVSPVRNDTSNIAEVMFYNATSKEVTYGNTISIAGNANVGNLSTTTAIITTGNITTINSGLLQNGNSNITLTANGNVSIQAAGSNVELVVTSTGANVTGTFNATGNITGSYLISAQASGDEGGEISLAQPPNGNLSGGITIDAYQNTLRMFEQGGTARGLSVDIANSPAGGGTAIGYRDIPQVAAGNVTLAATDAGKHYYSTTAGNLTLTIPLNSSVPFTTGTAISIVVQAAGNVLVNAASGVTLYMAGNSTAANRVVGGYGMATLLKVASDTWFINGAGVA